MRQQEKQALPLTWAQKTLLLLPALVGVHIADYYEDAN